MNIRTFALVLGIVFVAVGILGFVPALLTPQDRELVVQAMHGTLDVVSAPGAGSRFTIRLPAEPAATGEPTDA